MATRFARTPRISATCALLASSLLALALGCHRAPSPDVLATVNGKQILRSDVEKIYKANLGDSQQTPSPEQANIVRLNLLRELIDEEILLQRASKMNLVASDEEVAAKLADAKALSTQEEFAQRLKQQNSTLDDFKRDLRRSLTSTKLLNKEIYSKINITDAEINNYFAAHKSEFNLLEPRYDLAEIMVTSIPADHVGNLANSKAANDADAKKKIQQIHDRLDGGEDFGSLAMNLSEDPNTSSNGGDAGFIPESQLRSNTEVFNAVSKLKAGQITPILPIVQGEGASRRTVGYVIYKLISRDAAGQRELNDPRVQQAIRRQLLDAQAQLLKVAFLEILHDEAKVHNYFAEEILKQSGQ